MNNNNPLNLDKIAAKSSQNIVNETQDKKTLERLATKALGVLQNQGVYALMLFLLSRSGDEKEVAQKIKSHLVSTLEDLDPRKNLSNKNDREVLNYFSENISTDIDLLLLVRDLYEKILIYTRFHAKAEGD